MEFVKKPIAILQISKQILQISKTFLQILDQKCITWVHLGQNLKKSCCRV